MFKRFLKKHQTAKSLHVIFREQIRVSKNVNGYWAVMSNNKIIWDKSLSTALETMAIHLQELEQDEQ